jgi:hypothetical protein
MKKIKCPKCTYEWMEDVEKTYEDGDIPVFRRMTVSPLPLRKEKCVDLVCPNPKCENQFEYCWEE